MIDWGVVVSSYRGSGSGEFILVRLVWGRGLYLRRLWLAGDLIIPWGVYEKVDRWEGERCC